MYLVTALELSPEVLLGVKKPDLEADGRRETVFFCCLLVRAAVWIPSAAPELRWFWVRRVKQHQQDDPVTVNLRPQQRSTLCHIIHH